MVAICGGGTSGPNPLSEAVVLVGSARIAQLLETSGIPWLELAVPFLTLPPLVLATFCGVDPPAMPTFTSAEASALTQLTLGADFTSGLVKFAQLLTNLAWQDNCICTSGALVPPTPPAPPSGTPIPVGPSVPSGAPCFTFHAGTSVSVTGGSTYANEDTTGTAPPGVTTVVAQYTTSIASGAGCPSQVTLVEFTFGISGSPVRTNVYPLPASGVTTIQFTPSKTSYNRWAFDVAGNAGFAGTSNVGPVDWTMYCNGATPGLQNPCCPPDVATQATLDAILKMVTLMQRQIAPFGTIDGTAHAGLTGSGQFAVSGIIGLSVSLTAVPSNISSVAGDPLQMYGAGWVNTGTADGWGPRQFISSSPMLVELIPGNVTLVGYSLAPGVTATITEVLREP